MGSESAESRSEVGDSDMEPVAPLSRRPIRRLKSIVPGIEPGPNTARLPAKHGGLPSFRGQAKSVLGFVLGCSYPDVVSSIEWME